jgi:putative transposase
LSRAASMWTEPNVALPRSTYRLMTFTTPLAPALKSPPRSPTVNAICEHVIGTIRRECLDGLIALGPGVPDPPANLAVPLSKLRHRLSDARSICAKSILGGLHHEYSLAPA